MAAAGVTNVRGFHSGKRFAELQPYRDAELSLSGVLLWSPTRPITFPTSDLEGFKQYVKTEVSRYRGVVKSWEVWNEPPNFSEDMSPSSYAVVVAAAYDAAKSVDPSVQIGLAAKSVHVRFLAEAIAAGARDKFDYVSLHPYEVAALISHGCERTFLGIVDNVRAMLREQNPGRASVPVLFTEIGVELRDNERASIAEAEQADALIKIYSMSFAQGVDQVDWFDPRDSEGKHHGLLRGNGTTRPAYRAYQQLRAALGRTPRFLGWISLTPDSLGFLFAGPESDVVVTWLPPAKTREISLADAALMIDPASGEHTLAKTLKLAHEARLIAAATGSPLAAAWRKQARRDRAPWDQSSGAKEIELGTGTTAPALCLVNTVSTGQSEINLTRSRGAWFAVDPKFVGYAGAPLEVTLVARGHGQGAAGFNLKYESRKQIKAADGNGMVVKGSWNTVRGTRPTTFTWQIDDASFVSKYGPNLGLDCDGPEHCNFSILSLKIRKR